MKTKLLAALVLAMTFPAWSADPKPAGQPATQNGQPAPATEEQMIADFKADMFAKRADVMAKALTLTPEQASKFWPLFESYLKEQEPIVNAQIAATRHYAEHYQTLTDDEAVAYVTSLLERDRKIDDLRLKWLKKFQAVVPVKTAARTIHLDRRLSNLTQMQLSSQIPLVK